MTKDSKTWVLHQLDKMRKHKDYDKIINYCDDGDGKWHKRMESVISAMNLNSIECGDLYNDRDLYTSKWVQDSGSTSTTLTTSTTPTTPTTQRT